MDAEMSQALRAPFGAEQISKLPRITCPECRAVRGTKVCAKHDKSTCPECGSYITEKHIHLDYVGHADVTDRLLSVDPEWDWKPLVEDELGLPVITRSSDGQHIMWIKLIVGGMTRLGVGSVPPDSVDIEKQLIGDAIRNAAMRFGVALDLWSKVERAEPLARKGGGAAPKPVMIETTETPQGDASAVALSSEVGFAETDAVAQVQSDPPSQGTADTGKTAPTEKRDTPAWANVAVTTPSEFSYDEGEPLPEYHGEDGDADWGEDWGTAGGGFGRPAAAAQVQPVKVQPSAAQNSNEIAERGHKKDDTHVTSVPVRTTANADGGQQHGSAATNAGPPITEPQKTSIKAMLDELGIAQADRQRYVSQAVGREVDSIGGLTRSEGIVMMRWLVKERERRVAALEPVGANGSSAA